MLRQRVKEMDKNTVMLFQIMSSWQPLAQGLPELEVQTA